ncbi:potassium-transporting ATPase subunit C [Paraburkholderia sp. 40]|uniref:potassium-transporting ATPase subunit C n=1 Tax=unclassified Paraburkholderia TaxID=2615204 RepID=UPI003D243A62
MSWKHYALAVLVFNTLGVLVMYAFLRLQQWLPANPQGFGPVTPEAAFNTAISFATNANWQDSSGSGLDPEISPAASAYQAARVAKARGLPLDQVTDLVARNTSGRQFGIFGEPRGNVLKLNLALEDLKPMY